jgi:hypothetical protein
LNLTDPKEGHMAHAAQDGQTATRKLFQGFWLNKATPSRAIGDSLIQLAETLNHKLSEKALAGYLAVLADLTPAEVVQAFSRAAEELKFFPAPALLRDFASVAPSGDPIANEAREELFRIVAAMRVPRDKGGHGPKLQDIPGRVLYGTEEHPENEHGKPHHAPIRAAGTPFLLSRRTEAALVRLGWGDRTTGIALIAEHPVVAGRSSDDGQYATNRLRAGDELLAKFTAAYREV